MTNTLHIEYKCFRYQVHETCLRNPLFSRGKVSIFDGYALWNAWMVGPF